LALRFEKADTVAGPGADSSSLSSSDETGHVARLSKLEAELARQIRRQNYLAAVASQRAAECDAIREQHAAAAAESEALRGQLTTAQDDKVRLAARNAELQLALAAAERHGQNLQLQLDNLYRSTSWRLTRPLRGVMRLLRKGR
jgi:hypothetical protein